MRFRRTISRLDPDFGARSLYEPLVRSADNSAGLTPWQFSAQLELFPLSIHIPQNRANHLPCCRMITCIRQTNSGDRQIQPSHQKELSPPKIHIIYHPTPHKQWDTLHLTTLPLLIRIPPDLSLRSHLIRRLVPLHVDNILQ